MIKKAIQDERVVTQRRKIQSDGFSIMFIVLLISVLVQQFLFGAPFQQYAVELICFLGMSFYMIIRNIAVGNNIFGDSKRAKTIPLVNSLVTGITVTAINGVLNYARYSDKYQEDGIGFFIAVLGITFVSTTFFAFITMACISFLNKRKQASIQRQFDDMEKENDD